ncbi:uncharacterized protein PAE49_020709 isoform 7-T8 [Odontesthes bonariensis]|uniref:uncharacterized protein LOC142368165 isoform X5 n=1 Tax=Odontesthes bonariensis TaxID=219752 RepID=UPI003F58719B
MVVFLATTVSTAPVEEKEQEEVEVETTEEVEGELSEEEEDDDDSKSQDKIKGALGAQQTTTSVAGAGGSAHSGQSAGREPHAGAAGSSAGHGSAASSVDSAAAGRPSSSSGAAGSAVVEVSGVAAGQTHSAGADRPSASSHSEIHGSDGVDSESNGNGQKLLNGGGGGVGADSQTGVLGSFGGEVSHLDYTGIIDPSSHDFLLGFMGGGLVDPFSTDGHVNIPGHMTPPPHLDSTVVSSGGTAAPSAEQNILDSPADLAHHSAISIDQSGPDGASLSSGPDQSLSSSVSDPSYSADGADSPDTHGNGRQTLLTDVNEAVKDNLVSHSDLHTQSLQTDLIGGAESVTSLHIDLTASGLALGRDITESSPVILHTESVDGVTHTLSPVSGVHSHTDLVTITAADSTGTGTVTADPTGTPFDSSHPAVTDHTQIAGSVTEQYNPSGQGPEGAENLEAEDTC